MTGPAHDPQFHCLLFGILIFIGAFALGQANILRKFIRSNDNDSTTTTP